MQDNVPLPDTQQVRLDEAVRQVKESLNKMIATVQYRPLKGVGEALDEWVNRICPIPLSHYRHQPQHSVREWAYEHEVEDLADLLARLEMAIHARADVINGKRDGDPTMDLVPAHQVPAKPDCNTRPVRPSAYRAVGADLALEICRKHLSKSDEARVKVEASMQQAEETAFASIRSMVEQYFEHVP